MMLPGNKDWLTRAEWGACLGATLAAVAFHFVFLTHAGGLWRDEAGVVQLAMLPTLGEVWAMLPHGGTPGMFPALVRLWAAVGLGGSDMALRSLGLGIGLSILAALWLTGRKLGSPLPLISLALLAANASVLRWGDSLRAYGVGCLFLLLTLTAVWGLMLRPSASRFIVATAAAVLSVQCLYPSAFLVLGICLAGCFVCFRRRQGRAAALALGVGVAPALSLLPYAGPVTLSQRWWAVSQTGVRGSVAWANFFEAVGGAVSALAAVWFILCLLGVARGVVLWSRPARKRPLKPEDAPLFAAAAAALMIPLFVIFLLAARLPTQPWQFLPLTVPVAVCLDAVLAPWTEIRRWRLAAAALLLCVPLPWTVCALRQRQTNIDLLAARVSAEARPQDLVLVHPWFNGVTFSRYYRGKAPWTTLPQLADFRMHRYDLLRQQLSATLPVKPVLETITRTVAAGNSVWIVGELPEPAPGETQPPELPPAPGGPQGWFDVPYSYAWGRQADWLLKAHGLRPETLQKGSDDTSVYERASLAVVKGWGAR